MRVLKNAKVIFFLIILLELAIFFFLQGKLTSNGNLFILIWIAMALFGQLNWYLTRKLFSEKERAWINGIGLLIFGVIGFLAAYLMSGLTFFAGAFGLLAFFGAISAIGHWWENRAS